MTRRALTPLLVLAAVCLLGCQATPTIAPGTSAVRITVKAEPKAGVASHAQRLYVYDTPLAAKSVGDYERVDYSRLTDIILWLEPSAPSSVAPTPTPQHVHVDPARPPYQSLYAVSVGQRILLHNGSSKKEKYYSVSDNNDFDLAPIAANASAEWTVRSEGPIEILSDSTHEPVAQLYAAPSPYVARATSNKPVTFTNVPPGACKIVAYHPRLPGSEISIDLPADQIETATIHLGVNNLATAP